MFYRQFVYKCQKVSCKHTINVLLHGLCEIDANKQHGNSGNAPSHNLTIPPTMMMARDNSLATVKMIWMRADRRTL